MNERLSNESKELMKKAEVTDLLPLQQWQPCVPLKQELPPVEQLDYALLPASIRLLIEDAAGRMDNTAPDYAAVTAMACLGTLLCGKVCIQPKQHDDEWLVHPVIWAVLVGRPSSKKTPLLNSIISIMKKLESEAFRKFEEEGPEHRARQKTFKFLVEANEAKAKALIRNGKNDEASQLLKETEELAFEPPTVKRYIINDATTPKIGELLSSNPTLLLVRDELTGLLKSLDRDDRQEDRAFYLEFFNGCTDFTYDRIMRGTVRIVRASLCIVGAIQPARLTPYLQAQLNGAGDDGLIERFQLAVYPDKPYFKHSDQPPNKDARNQTMALFRRLDSIPHPKIDEKPTKYKFSHEAQQAFDQWYKALHKRLESDELIPQLESHLGKFPKLVASIALIMHMCSYDTESPISLEAITQAICWADYLESHARRIYALANDPFVGARALVDKLSKLKSPFTTSDFLNKGWKHLATGEEAKRALSILVDHHYLQRRIVETTGGRNKTEYHINPQAIKKPDL